MLKSWSACLRVYIYTALTHTGTAAGTCVHMACELMVNSDAIPVASSDWK